MDINALPFPRLFLILQAFFALVALAYCSLWFSIKLGLCLFILLMVGLAWRKKPLTHAQYMAQSHDWILFDQDKSCVAQLLAHSFVGPYCMVLNWRHSDSSHKTTMMLFRWRYDKATWRRYRRFFSQYKI